jgi:hypothetical protein
MLDFDFRILSSLRGSPILGKNWRAGRVEIVNNPTLQHITYLLSSD